MSRDRIALGRIQSQRGAAALIVVMLLFFAVSLTAAYTSRNLIFEQKTSANQFRGTSAFEAAEAGIEWALTQLNGGLINSSCGNTTPTLSFQQRYLAIFPFDALSPPVPNPPVPQTGHIRQVKRVDPLPAAPHAHNLWPTCVFNGTDWDCRCPIDTGLNPTPPTGAGPFPAFRVWPAVAEPTALNSSPWATLVTPRPGVFPLHSVGCTRLPAGSTDNCLDYLPRGEVGDGVAVVRAMVALRSGLAVPPAAAVTARGEVTPHPVVPLKVINKDADSGAITVNTGEPVDRTRFSVESLDGTPGEASFIDDDSRLQDFANVAPATTPPAPPALTPGERMFVSIFGVRREVYRNQPGLRVCADPCSATAINGLLANHPQRIIWVEGDLTLDDDIGDDSATPKSPVLLVVNGSRLALDPDVRIYGFVYMIGNPITGLSTLELPNAETFIEGALVAEGDLSVNYAGTPASGNELTITYNREALDLLRLKYGSWVRLGGGWRDFRATP